MRKLLFSKTMLLLACMVMGVASVWADEVTFTAGTDLGKYTSQTNDESMTKDGITVAANSGAFAITSGTPNYRFYASNGSKFTVSSIAGDITSIVITSTASGTSNYSPAKVTSVTPGEKSVDGKVLTWTGNTSSVEFTLSAQFRATKIVVTYTPAAVAAPTFSPAAGEVSIGTVVTISAETGCTLKYTTNGDDPTEDGADATETVSNTASVTINEATTIKAVAVNGSDVSSVATAVYTTPALSSIALAGKTTTLTISAGSFQTSTGGSYTNYDDATLTGSDGNYYSGWNLVQAMKNNGNLQMNSNKSSSLTSPTITSLYGARIKVIYGAGKALTLKVGSDSATGDNGGGASDISNSVELTTTSKSFTFTLTPNGATYVKDIEITPLPASVSAEVTSAGYATLASEWPLDFSSVAGLTAYTASVSGDVVTFNEVPGTVPANTGLLLKGEGNYDIPVVASSMTDVSGNALVGSVAGGVIGKTTDGKTNYVLKQVDDVVGFYQVNNDSYKVRAGSAYLAVDLGGSAKPFIGLGDETSVNEELRIQHSEFAPVYNLAGQRVDAGFHGIVIQNGKKVIR